MSIALKSGFRIPRVFSLVSMIVMCTVLNLSLVLPALAKGAWSIVPSANACTQLCNNTLNGVTAISDNDVWAVGDVTGLGVANQTLTEHWNGSKWSVIASPNVNKEQNTLRAVSAVSSTDVWAAGFFFADSVGGGTRGLIEHWNGIRWIVVPTPNPTTHSSLLSGIAAVSASDVWAAGSYENDDQTAFLPLIEHWNGIAWSVVKVPTNSDFTTINSISARAANDVWAVGHSFPGEGTVQTNVALHWNGSEWTVTPFADFPSLGEQDLNGVSAVATDDAWAVGSYATPIDGFTQTLAIHWNGKQWSKAETPNFSTSLNQLFAVSAVSSKDVWAVGWGTTADDQQQTLIEHWNGLEWSIVPSPNMTPQKINTNILLGVTKSSAGKLWAVGTWQSLVQGNPGFQTLTLHFA
jgi:hypothetical protein